MYAFFPFWSSNLDFPTTDRDRPASHLQSPVLESLTFIRPLIYFTAILLERSSSPSRHPRSFSANMDAQWQQFYWQHYLLQQQQQQQTSGQQTHQYTPTGAYGPLTHAVRTQQAHQHHPYTPSPGTDRPRLLALHRVLGLPLSPWPPTPPDHPANTMASTFDVFPWLLAYHGAADYTARTLSHGKFCGLIPTRSIAESVFTTHLLQEIRDRRFDLDAIAEALHTAQGTTIPNKTTQARAFHAPLIAHITEQLQTHAPAAAEGSALRALKSTTDDLARARQKLQAHGIELTPRKDAGRSSTTATLPSAPTPTNLQHWPTSCNLPPILKG